MIPFLHDQDGGSVSFFAELLMFFSEVHPGKQKV